MSRATEAASDLVMSAMQSLARAGMELDEHGEPEKIAQTLAEAGDAIARAIVELDGEYSNFGCRVMQEAVLLAQRAG